MLTVIGFDQLCVDVQDNDKLVNLNGLSGITSVDGYLLISVRVFVFVVCVMI